MPDTNTYSNSFHELLKNDLAEYTTREYHKFPANELLKIDLHCHDHNSDIPDELLGRILNIPETWLKTKKLVKVLEKNQCDVITITNHNNARSCYELLDKGMDILTGAEFSCFVPDYNIGIHVLAYGFTQKQESRLNKFRKNIYQFQEYACNEDIPTIWAHPLYHYSSQGLPPFDFFNKLALIFERFEVINGQRDTWQNMLVKVWLETLTPETIDKTAKKFNIKPLLYCKDPYLKASTGGSDSHMGLFAGLTGSYLWVPGLEQELKTRTKTELALEAIRKRRIAPFGSHNNSEKLTVAFLDYVFQVAMFRKDPGLLRILLHKGTTQDKIIAFLVSNGFAEIQQHKTTMRFIELSHNCLGGKVPVLTKKWMVPKPYKSIFQNAIFLAETNRNQNADVVQANHKAIIEINRKLNEILFSRLEIKLEKLTRSKKTDAFDFNAFLDYFEIPSEIRTIISPDKHFFQKKISYFDLPEFLDGLSLPFLASSLILAANYTSARVLYKNRPLLAQFSEMTGKYTHPRRMLWLTDTFEDNNGVSTVLKSVLKEIQDMNFPIDLLICSNKIEPQDHLIVIKPELEYTLPFYAQQPLRIPNFLTIHEIFQQGEYDRVMCSTEGPMGLAAIYLKYAFSVKAHFYIHTDWITFVRKVVRIDSSNLNRFRRLLRAFYGSFDTLFVLNTDQQKWLTGRRMGFSNKNVYLTAHWTDDEFTPQKTDKKKLFGFEDDAFVMLYSGRLSREKGVFELPVIYEHIKEKFPGTEMIIAGTGPDEAELKKQLPGATFLGWIDHNRLPDIYSCSDILVLPSKFDTFSLSVLESISCGLPVIAYKTKGPKDIILDKENGMLVKTTGEMVERLSNYITDCEMQKHYTKNALQRAKKYRKDLIMNKLLQDVGLPQAKRQKK